MTPTELRALASKYRVEAEEYSREGRRLRIAGEDPTRAEERCRAAAELAAQYDGMADRAEHAPTP